MFDIERPFNRLVRHFIYRTFYGAGNDGGDLQFGIPILLGVLSTPSAFSSIMLLGKYSTLRMFFLGIKPINVYRVSIPDEYFFIVYSMAITGAIVILKWDRLFPDRQDYDNLAPLPLSSLQIFLSSLTAMLFLAVLFAVDINVAACFIFPLAVTSQYTSFYFYREFFVAHASSLILSSLFTCFGLLSVMGMTMLVVPLRYLRTASLAVRIACALLVVTLVGSAFSIPPVLLDGHPPAWVSYIPSVWFLDIYEGLLDHGTALTGLGRFAVELTASLFVLALATYALTYYRHFTRIPEQTGVAASGGRDKPTWLQRGFDRFILRTPFQRAICHFALKTLFRSERQCLLFGGAVSIGFFLAAQSITDSLSGPIRGGPSPGFLAVPLILAYFIIVSLRALFDLPTDGDANWIFRTLVNRDNHEARSAGTKIMMTMIVPWLVLIGLPIYAVQWGWVTASLHVGYVLICSIALAELLLVRFRKIPFACKRTVSKDRVLVNIIFCMVGFSIFGPANAVFEASLLKDPLLLLLVLPWFIAILWGVGAVERDVPRTDRILVFEDYPADLIQLLDLSR